MEINKDIVVLYHANCNDGFMSALAAYYAYGNNANYIPVQYTEKTAPDGLAGKRVFILDFSYSFLELSKLEGICKKVTLIDHHETAIKNVQEFLNNPSEAMEIVFSLDNSESGAVLAFKYFFPKHEPPALAYAVQDADLFQWKVPDSKYIGLALKYYCGYNFETWKTLLGYDLTKLIEYGKVIAVAQLTLQEELPEPHYITIGGVIGLALNADVETYKTSLGNKLAIKSGTFGCVYQYLGDDVWKFSLRSLNETSRETHKTGINVNVLQLCEKYGGSGHKHAASFYLTSLQMSMFLHNNYELE